MDLVSSKVQLLCRACLLEAAISELHDISEQCFPDEPEVTLQSVFFELTGLQMDSTEEGLPRWLCGACAELARAFYSFRRKCHESHRRLIAHNHHTQESTDIIPISENGSDSESKPKVSTVYISKEDPKRIVKRKNNGRTPKRTNKACEQLYGEALWRPASCSECSVTVENVPTLIAHRTAHHAARFQCLQCGGGLTTSRGLRLHQRRHAGARPEVCCTCGATFSDPRTRIIHEKRHAGTLAHVCTSCGRAFPARRPLERHHATQHPHQTHPT